MNNKVATIITDKIIKQLENGTVPWIKPWTNKYQASYTTKNPYTGINQLILQLEARENNYKSNLWLTFKQAVKLGDIRGQKSTPIVFWGLGESEEEDSNGKKKTYRFMRYYRVFNADQVKGLQLPDDQLTPVVKPQAETVINNYLTRENIKLIEGGNVASYNPRLDQINMPSAAQFKDSNARYQTLFHELSHSTGLESRLNRFKADTNHNFGSTDYSKEELIAELGAAILCHSTGITPDIKQSSAYIKSWLQVLKNDRSMIISASSKADKASKYILG